MNIVLLEKLPEIFFKKAYSLKLNVYDFSDIFKNYKTIYNYKNFNQNKKSEVISKIKNEILIKINSINFNSKNLNSRNLSNINFNKINLNVNDLDQFLKTIDIVIFRTKLIVDKDLIDLFPDVKMFIRSGSGFENIDFLYCFKKNIFVQNIPEANEISAFEHTLALTFAGIKKVTLFDSSIRNGKWRNNYPFNINLSFKNILIIGYGRIGKKIAKAYLNFNCNVYVFDPFFKDLNIKSNVNREDTDDYEKVNNSIKILGNKNIDDIDETIKQKIDIISLHVPLWDKTYHFINKKTLTGFKDNVIIVNTARGEVINEDDIYELLVNNKIGLYLADVFGNEPAYKNKLFSLTEKTIFTPHVGAYTKEAKEKLVDLTLKAIDYFKKTSKCLYKIDRRFYFSEYYR